MQLETEYLRLSMIGLLAFICFFTGLGKLKIKNQAGAELGKAQPKLGPGKININLALDKSRKVVLD